MSAQIFVDSSKIMAKGQVTIPKDIRNILGVSRGDRISKTVNIREESERRIKYKI